MGKVVQVTPRVRAAAKRATPEYQLVVVAVEAAMAVAEEMTVHQ